MRAECAESVGGRALWLSNVFIWFFWDGSTCPKALPTSGTPQCTGLKCDNLL